MLVIHLEVHQKPVEGQVHISVCDLRHIHHIDTKPVIPTTSTKHHAGTHIFCDNKLTH